MLNRKYWQFLVNCIVGLIYRTVFAHAKKTPDRFVHYSIDYMAKQSGDSSICVTSAEKEHLVLDVLYDESNLEAFIFSDAKKDARLRLLTLMHSQGLSVVGIHDKKTKSRYVFP